MFFKFDIKPRIISQKSSLNSLLECMMGIYITVLGTINAFVCWTVLAPRLKSFFNSTQLSMKLRLFIDAKTAKINGNQ